MGNSITNKRRPELDWLKGIGILAVIVGHYLSYYTYNYVYSFHMPLFFFLGGLLYSAKNVATSFRKDFSRLIVPFLWTNVAYILFFLVWGYRHHYYDLAKEHLQAIFYCCATHHQHSRYWQIVPIVGPIWFLPAFFWCKNIYNLIRGKYHILISFVLGVLATYLHYEWFNAPLGLLVGCSAMMFYAIGELAQKSDLFHKPRPICFLVALAFWLVASWYYPASSCTCYYPNLLINIPGAMGMIYMLYHLARRFPFKPLEWIGQNSLWILCIHSFFFSTNYFFSSRFIPSGIGYCLFDLCMSVIGIIGIQKMTSLIQHFTEHKDHK